MKANVIHSDLNPCGGAEQLALATLQSLLEMNMEVDLTVAKEPNLATISKAFGEKVNGLFQQIRIRPLGRLPVIPDKQTGALVPRQDVNNNKAFQDSDIIVNTHADVLPFFLPSFSSKNFITYCHYPVAVGYLKSRHLQYLKSLLDWGLLDAGILEMADRDSFWRSLLNYYMLMLSNSLIVTNSMFSQQAIVGMLKACYGKDRTRIPRLIAPPASVDEIRKATLFSVHRKDVVLVVSRINPSKKLENAIKVAHILKERSSGTKMMIVGNLLADDPACCKYLDHLLDMVQCFALSDSVVIKPSIHIRNLWSLMQESKVYLHPMLGEPFGISVVEAMAAGLVPVVPNVGGTTEFVPQKYQFASLDQAADKILTAMQVSDRERMEISESVRAFSSQEYKNRFSQLLGKVLPASMLQEKGAKFRTMAEKHES